MRIRSLQFFLGAGAFLGLNFSFINCGGSFNVKEPQGISVSTVSPLSVASFSFETVVLDGLETFFRIPNAPKGVIYFFHGAVGGAKSFSRSIEGRAYAERAFKKGYAVVFVESVDRVERKWRPTLDLDRNAELKHISKIREYLQKYRSVPNTLDHFGVGMSNGGGFVPYAAYYFKFAAIGIYCAPGYSQVFEQTDYNIPVFYLRAANDSVVEAQKIQSNYDYLVSKRVSAELKLHTQGVVSASLFTKIPNVSSGQSLEIFNALITEGLIDSQGQFKRSPAGLSAGSLPTAYIGFFAGINELLLEAFAEHRFSSRYADLNLNFFDRYRSN